MKILKNLLIAIIITTPTYLFAQNIDNPTFISSSDKTTSILNIEVKGRFTIVTFEHPGRYGGWIQVNEGMYLQDANGQTKYDFVKAENIPLVPEKYYFKDGKNLVFKVYFHKLKKGTKSINIIERALSEEQQQSTTTFLNYFGVSLENSRKD